MYVEYITYREKNFFIENIGYKNKIGFLHTYIHQSRKEIEMKNYIKRNGKPDVIVIDESKFTADDLIKLDEYRELSFRLHILYKCFYGQYIEAESKKKKNGWLKCMDLVDQIRCEFEDEMFDEYPQLPDSAMKIFY